MSEQRQGNKLLEEITRRLEEGGAGDAALSAVLGQVLSHFDCAVGTIHGFDPATSLLHLRVCRGIPDSILNTVRSIPVGKGMAGIAAERRAPVQVCNLQKDTSGVAKAGAKETKMEGSIAVPMLVDGELRGVLGVAKPVPYDFSEVETSLLLEVASAIGRSFSREPRASANDK
jgi:L-methionine (R)-S-oxide reductase